MATNLSKKEKAVLLTCAAIIAFTWFLPFFITKGKIWYANFSANKEKKVETTIKKQNLTEIAVEKYLEGLKISPTEDISKILGIENPIISRFEIVNVTGNNEKARVDVKIFVINSYLEKSLSLTRNNDLWEVEKMEGPLDLNYERNGFLIKHNSDWKIYSSNNILGALSEWTLKSSNEEDQAIFFVEGKEGNYTKAFTECVIADISNCKEEILGENKFKTAVYMEYIDTYVLERGESSLVILDISGGNNTNEFRQILSDIKIQ